MEFSGGKSRVDARIAMQELVLGNWARRAALGR